MSSFGPRASPHCVKGPVTRPIFTDFYRFLPIFSDFLPSSYLLSFQVCCSPVGLPSVSFTSESTEFLPIFRTFLGDSTTSMLLFERLHVFFPDSVLRRN